MRNKSGTDVAPLPQGGGATQGIGETVSPDLFTGTGNFGVPVILPPGCNGFQPQEMSIEWNSMSEAETSRQGLVSHDHRMEFDV